MKTLNVLSLLFAGSMLAACGETMDANELPPDSEFGLETLDAKSDSFAVRPGSAEGDAVVRFVNQEIQTPAQGTAFRDHIDTKLHGTAAKNVAKFRAGADGVFGTQDDRVFADLAELDRVPYVGRTALMQLLELAEAAGYFQRASLDCADYVDHDRYNNYTIDSYADLLEYENSKCTTINGNLYFQISGTDLLPPSARAVRNLRHLRTVNGNVQITTSNHITGIYFEGLETVTGQLYASSPLGQMHTLDFPVLKAARNIRMEDIKASLFGALETNDKIELTNSDYTGFKALKHVKELNIRQDKQGAFTVLFPALTEAGSIAFNVTRPNSWTNPDVTFDGSFAKLAKADSLSMTYGNYAQLGFPRLVEVVGSVYSANTIEPYAGMTKLAKADGLSSNADSFASMVHSGPVALKEVGSIYIDSQLPIDGYNAVTTIHNNVNVQSYGGMEGFKNVTAFGGSLNANLGRVRNPMKLSGFDKLTFIKSVSIAANNAPVTVGALFENLENIEGGLALTNNGGFDKNPAFLNLGSIGGGMRVDALLDGVDMMPVLEIVDGNVEINRTPAELTGFPKLERIEGTLTLKAYVNKMTGMAKLTAIGGNLSVPRSLTGVELDAFLNRLTEFSGTINYN